MSNQTTCSTVSEAERRFYHLPSRARSNFIFSVNIMNIEIDDEVDMNVFEDDDDDDDNEDELLPPVSGTALIAS